MELDNLNKLNELFKEQSKIIDELTKKNRELEFQILVLNNKINVMKEQIEIINEKIANK